MTSVRLVTTVMAAVTVALVVVPAMDRALAQGNSTALGTLQTVATSVEGGSAAGPSEAEAPTASPEAEPTSNPSSDHTADQPADHTADPTTPGHAASSAPRRAPARAHAPGRKVVYLTIDDGPGEATPQVLDILARHGVAATFFVIGEHVAEHPQMLERIRDEGHLVGNHTWTHPWLTKLSPAGIRSELGRTETVTGGTRCMRAPGGLTNPAVTEAANDLGLALVDWTADSRDWEQPGVAAITRNVLDNLSPGGTILLHDGGGPRTQTVAALDGLLTTLTRSGYVFETIPECR